MKLSLRGGKRDNERKTVPVSLSPHFCGLGLKKTEECLTSDPFRQEVTDTQLTAQHCASPRVEIPVNKCVYVCALRIQLTQTPFVVHVCR